MTVLTFTTVDNKKKKKHNIDDTTWLNEFYFS